MAREEGKRDYLYGVLGLNKECGASELRSAYKKLALKWHPDWGNSKSVEEAKKKIQAIQQAYSVLSDTNKRFLYDVGVYDFDDDDEENGMGDFLNEMVVMRNDTRSNEQQVKSEISLEPTSPMERSQQTLLSSHVRYIFSPTMSVGSIRLSRSVVIKRPEAH